MIHVVDAYWERPTGHLGRPPRRAGVGPALGKQQLDQDRYLMRRRGECAARATMAPSRRIFGLSLAGTAKVRAHPERQVSTHCGHSKIYVLDSEFRWDHDRPQPIGDRSWTSGIGCAASVSASTRPYFARMTSTPRF